MFGTHGHPQPSRERRRGVARRATANILRRFFPCSGNENLLRYRPNFCRASQLSVSSPAPRRRLHRQSLSLPFRVHRESRASTLETNPQTDTFNHCKSIAISRSPTARLSFLCQENRLSKCLDLHREKLLIQHIDAYLFADDYTTNVAPGRFIRSKRSGPGAPTFRRFFKELESILGGKIISVGASFQSWRSSFRARLSHLNVLAYAQAAIEIHTCIVFCPSVA